MIEKLEKILQSIGFGTKLTYKLLIFGHKEPYPVYNAFNTLLSCVFFSIYKYWLHNQANVNVGSWVYSHLNLQRSIYQDLHDEKQHKLFDEVVKRWN